MPLDAPSAWLSDPAHLVPAITAALQTSPTVSSYVTPPQDVAAASGVLFLLGRCRRAQGVPGEVCLILNKRSRRVRQAGDLCCPGGSVARFDFLAARLLALPFGTLGRWAHWRVLRRERPVEARWLALYLATALREAFEEMGLNPLRVRFLGPLPPNRLQLFRRAIYPLVAWLPTPAGFRPNWEVDRIVHLPLRELLDPAGYVCYQISRTPDASNPETVARMPAFRLHSPPATEILWGATYRITMDFLRIVFDFVPPTEGLPVVAGELAGSYLTGER
jgi:8-oxo-dGTP pyrophosphatase MutT (NUDIX family)